MCVCVGGGSISCIVCFELSMSMVCSKEFSLLAVKCYGANRIACRLR